MLSLAKEIEIASSIDSSFQMEVKQSNDFIQRNIYVYNNCIYPWEGIFIRSVIRVDKIVNCKVTRTHYYISNDTDNAESF